MWRHHSFVCIGCYYHVFILQLFTVTQFMILLSSFLNSTFDYPFIFWCLIHYQIFLDILWFSLSSLWGVFTNVTAELPPETGCSIYIQFKRDISLGQPLPFLESVFILAFDTAVPSYKVRFETFNSLLRYFVI